MPWVTINMMAGHNQEQKAALCRRVTKSISETLDLPEECIRIQIVEMSADNHAVAGKMMNEIE